MKLIYSTSSLARNNIRYIIASLVILLTFLISNSFFIFQSKTITSESCRDNKCTTANNNTTLSNEKPYKYINNYYRDLYSGGYFRLLFRYLSDGDSKIVVKALKTSEEKLDIKTIKLKKTDNYSQGEVIFFLNEGYPTLLLEKADKIDNNIAIENIFVSKLNIDSDTAMESLEPTIVGTFNQNIINQRQSDHSSEKFNDLIRKGAILGQIFESENDYITSVVLDIDVTKKGTGGPKEYKLELRNVDIRNNEIKLKSKSLAELSFSLNDLEKYRQEDGRIRFPIFASLQKGRKYFIGIDSDKVETNKFNYLTLRGSKDDSSYPKGTAILKENKKTLKLKGDLYFIVYGAAFDVVNNDTIIPGSIIEDLGNSNGIFRYHPSDSRREIIKLYSRSSDISFSNDEKIIYGSAKKDKSEFVYKINTVYPFKKMQVAARQADPRWRRVVLLYSYDQESWKEIPSFGGGEINTFNYTIKGNNTNIIYIKTTYSKNSLSEKDKYGLSDFSIKSELKLK